MNFNEYQKRALRTAKVDYGTLIQRTIWAMGVAGEAGEVIEKWKKIVAYKEGKVNEEDRSELAKELGDVVWYIAVFCHSLGLTFEEVMQVNVEKLVDRQKRNVIKGAGDNR